MTENIDIVVSDGGTTSSMTALLEAFGLTGAEALDRLENGLQAYSNESKAAADAAIILQKAINAGIRDTEVLRDALAQLTEVELMEVASSEQVAAALGRLGIAEQASALEANGAAAALEKQALAARAAAESSTQSATAIAATAKGVGGLTSAFSFLTSGIGAYITASAFIKASDEYTTAINQLRQVTGSTEGATAAFHKLNEVASGLQMDVGQATRTLFGLDEAMGHGKESTDQLITSTTNILQALRNVGISGATASRVLKDYNEYLVSGGTNTRVLNSLNQQAPGFLDQLARATGVAAAEQKNHNVQLEQGQLRLDELKAKRDGDNQSVSSATTAYNANEAAIKRVATEQQNAINGTDKYGTAVANTTKAHTAGANQANYYGKELKSLGDKQGELAANVANATDRQNGFLDKQIAIQEQKNAALAKNNIAELEAALASDKTTAALKTQGNVTDTIAGSFTVLNNKLSEFAGTSTEGKVASAALSAVIKEVADHLDIIIPVAAAFFALLAADKAITSVKNISKAFDGWTIATRAQTAAMVILDTVSSPWFLAVAGIGLIIAGVITYTIGWSKAIEVLTAWYDKLKAAILGAKDAQDGLNKSRAAAPSTPGATGDNGGADAVGRNTQGNGLPIYISPANDPGAISGDGRTTTYRGGALGDGPTTTMRRDGGSWMVPGGGGVDSVPVSFMASPGETVSVQTPAQQKGMASVPHFRDGGTFGVGVDLGLSGSSVVFTSGGSTGIASYAAPANSNVSASGTAATPATAAAAVQTQIGTNQVGGTTVAASPVTTAVAAGATKTENYAAAVKALSSLFGVSKPTGGPDSTVTDQQREVWVYNTDHWDINPGATGRTASGGAVSGYTEAFIELKQKGFRDGTDFIVPGGTGVDSQNIQMAVSPGERVIVQTPEQQRRNGLDNGSSSTGGGVTHNWYIQTSDADSFNRSKAQIADEIANNLRRASR